MKPTEKIRSIAGWLGNSGPATRQYLEAVGRIDDQGNGEFYASGTGMVNGDGTLLTASHGLVSPLEVRNRAFEMLVLADLAEATREGAA
jgi:hypothetical protein